MLEELKSFLDELKLLRKDVKAEHVTRIAKKSLRDRAEGLGSRWFNDFSKPLTAKHGFSAELIERNSSP